MEPLFHRHKKHATHKKRNRNARFSLSGKLTMVAAFLACLAIAAFAVFVGSRAGELFKTVVTDSTRAVIDASLKDLDTYYGTLKTYSLSLRNDDTFMAIISSKQARDYRYDSYMQTLLRNHFYARDDIDSYSLYIINSGTRYTMTKDSPNVNIRPNPPLTEIPGFEESSKSPPYHSLKRSNEGLFTITRTIVDIQSNTPLAVVELTVDSIFFDTLSQNSIYTQGALCLFCPDSKLLYTNRPDIVNPGMLVELSPALVASLGRGNTSTTLGGTEYTVVALDSPLSGFKLAHLLPKAFVAGQSDRLSKELTLFILLALLLFVLFLHLYSRYLTYPFYRFSEDTTARDTGWRKTLRQLDNSAEIHMLTDRLGTLTQRAKTLEKQSAEIADERSAALLFGLEVQAGSMFLRRTVIVLSSPLIHGAESKLPAAANALTTLFDYVSRSGETAAVKDALLLAEAYLDLTKNHARTLLHFHVEAEENAKRMRIPRMLIFPLIDHALDRVPSPRYAAITFELRALVQGNRLVIVARDSGPPLSPGRLEELRRLTDLSAVTPSVNFGSVLTNLVTRLKLLYGDSAAVTFCTDPDGLTAVTLSLPAMEEEE